MPSLNPSCHTFRVRERTENRAGGALESREQITSQWVISTHLECMPPGIENLS